jgi:hypothetical protein
MFAKAIMIDARATMILILGASLPAWAHSFAGGTGEPNDPYQIATAEQLVSIGSDPNLLDKHFVLIHDIDLDPNLPGGRVFTTAVIAPTTGGKAFFWGGAPFTGTLDGRDHRICNLTIRAGGTGHLGLFGYLDEQAVVKDLGIADADVGDGGSYCGALAGTNCGRVSRCYAEGRVSGGWCFVGGLLGCNVEGEVIDCRAEGEVAGGEFLGGLVGDNWEGMILNSHTSCRVVCRWNDGSTIGGLVGNNWGSLVNCSATGDVSTLASSLSIGGLAGVNAGDIVNCRATGNVTVAQGREIGGLVGENSWCITRSYATGTVSGGTTMYGSRNGKPVGSWSVGGLVGWNYNGRIHACYAGGEVLGGDAGSSLGGLVGAQGGDVMDSYCVGRVRPGENSTQVGGLAGSGGKGIAACFWDIEASGLAESAGGSGLTTAQMQDAATFLAAGWDWVGEQANGLVDPWFIPEAGGYPMLTFGSDVFQPHPLNGSGTMDDPYGIATPTDLGAVNHYDPLACYRLEADIDLAGIAWREPPIRYFNGRFDGAGRTVLNLKVQGNASLGLFGLLDQRASVMSLGICDANIVGKWSLAVLAAKNRGRIEACCAGGVINGIDGIGVLVSWNEGSIGDSYALGEVTTIDPRAESVGGLVGSNPGSINRCYAAVRVIQSAPAQADVNGVGGLVGVKDLDQYLYPPGQIYDSYFLTDAYGGGPDNGLGVPLAATQMHQQTSFVGFDFETTWTICEGWDYPRLRWEAIDCNRP